MQDQTGIGLDRGLEENCIEQNPDESPIFLPDRLFI